MIHTDITFTGFYGQLNTGDDAFVEVASWGASHFWQKKNNRFLAIGSRLPDTIAPSAGYPLTIPKTYDFQKKIILNNTDYLVSAGGSTIHSRLSDSNPKQIALNLKQKGKKIKVGAIGVSVGPFASSDDERAVKEYLKAIDFIALRDKSSYDYVSSLDNLSYNPVLAFDLAALLPDIYLENNNIKIDKEKKIVGISVCPVESIQKNGNTDNEKRRIQKITELIKELSKENISFKFFIINGNDKIGDMEITRKVISAADLTDYEIVDYKKETKQMWQHIESCDFVLSVRLHAGIFACFAGVPFMLVEYHKKCSDFLTDVGYDDQARVFDADFTLHHTKSKIMSWLENKQNYRVPLHHHEMIQKARKNFTDIDLQS